MKENVMHLLFTNKYGGAEKAAIDIIKETRGEIFSVYVSQTGDIMQQLNESKISNVLLSEITLKNIRDIIKEKNIGIIHAHDFRASLIASLFSKKVKIVSQIHQSPPWINKRTDMKFFVYNLVSSRFSKIYVTSNEIANSKLFSNKKQINILPNYVETNNKYLLNTKKIYDFIFVGRFEKVKNPHKFVQFIGDFAKMSPNINAIMLGDGSLYNEINNIIEENNYPIKLKGFTTNTEEYMLKSKFFVSTSENEGFGIALVEALQLGIPVITTMSGGVSDEIIDTKNGLLIKNSENYLKKVEHFYNDHEDYKALRHESIVLGDKYRNKEEWKRQILGGYNDIKK